MKNNYRILMFAPWFPPNRSSEANTTGNLVLAMLKKGWHVDVISEPRYDLQNHMQFSPHWSALEKFCHPVPLKNKPSNKYLDYITKANALFSMRYPIKGISWARYAYLQAKILCEKNNYDVILSRTPRLYGHLPALHIAQKTKLPWIANWNDVKPASRSPIPYDKGRDNKADLFTETFVRKVVAAATHHTVPSKRLLDYMTYWVPDLKLKATVIPHIALENNKHHQSIVKSDKFKICHAGIFDGKRNPKPLFVALDLLLQKNPQYIQNLELLLLGNNFASTFSEPIPPNLVNIVKVLPWCDYEQSLSIMQQASVLLILEADMKNGIMLPAKLADYVYCRRPLLSLSPRNGTMHDLITNHGGGIVADCTSPNDIMCALDKLYKSWEAGVLETEYPLNGLDSVIGEKSVIAKYEDILLRLLYCENKPHIQINL